MATSLFPDPFQFWREALTRLENQANGLATDSLRSQDLVRSLHELSGATLSLQQMFDKGLGEYLRRANLPSRKDITDLSQALQRIESKLDMLLPAEAVEPPKRPARTRRPPESPAPSPAAAASAVAEEAKPAPKTEPEIKPEAKPIPEAKAAAPTRPKPAAAPAPAKKPARRAQARRRS